MSEWLTTALRQGDPLSEETIGFLLGRGMRESRIADMGFVQWARPSTPCPEPDFVKHYGLTGCGDTPPDVRERAGDLRDYFLMPFYSPRGSVLGFEGRLLSGVKKITDYRTPDAKWNPVFLGLTPSAMKKIWDGGDVWVVEGVFDLGALERVVPEKDVVLSTIRAKLSDTHVAFLRRFVKGRVHMVYDNDATGQKQMHGWTDDTGKRRWGALERLSRVGVEARAVTYQGGKDPGEVWDRGGQAGLDAAFRNATIL